MNRDVIAEIPNEVCHNVRGEPQLFPKGFNTTSANRSCEARLDINEKEKKMAYNERV